MLVPLPSIIETVGHILHFPHASAETEVARQQCAHRTDVNRVAGELRVERRVAQRVDHRLGAARHQFEHRVLRDLVLERVQRAH
jgi:hypothetical protein